MSDGKQPQGPSHETGTQIAALQQVLLSAGDPLNAPTLREDLCQLEQRLMRIRSWGGPFGDITFSPDMQRLMDARQATPAPAGIH